MRSHPKWRQPGGRGEGWEQADAVISVGGPWSLKYGTILGGWLKDGGRKGERSGLLLSDADVIFGRPPTPSSTRTSARYRFKSGTLPCTVCAEWLLISGRDGNAFWHRTPELNRSIDPALDRVINPLSTFCQFRKHSFTFWGFSARNRESGWKTLCPRQSN